MLRMRVTLRPLPITRRLLLIYRFAARILRGGDFKKYIELAEDDSYSWPRRPRPSCPCGVVLALRRRGLARQRSQSACPQGRRERRDICLLAATTLLWIGGMVILGPGAFTMPLDFVGERPVRTVQGCRREPQEERQWLTELIGGVLALDRWPADHVLFQTAPMCHKRFSLYCENLKVMFGKGATCRAKPFEKRRSVGTFFAIFGEA
jgi:hypothetical protein